MRSQSADQMGMTTRPILASDWIASHANANSSRTALIDVPSLRRFSYGELHERVARAAAFLQGVGIKSGDRVGFYCFNTTDIIEWLFASWRIGAVCVALNFRLTAAELAFIINDAGPRVILFDRAHADVVNELIKTTEVARWVETGGDGSDSEYEKVLAAQQDLILAPTVDRQLGDLAMLMYSSGTTGKPKGVMITHEMLLFSAHAIAIATGLSYRSVGLAAMPLFHIGAFNIFTAPLLCFGGTAIVLRSFDPGTVLDLFDDAALGITHFLGAPAIYNALLAHPKSASADLSRLTAAFVGAEAVPESLLKAWHARGVSLREGYGLTETAACTSILPEADVFRKIGSAGKPFMHCEIRLVTADGEAAPPGTSGEILTRGPMVTPGYWNRDEANRDSFIDGWFRTGDVGVMDQDGYLYITDRVKDMYISGGENVYPAEVENVLFAMDEVSEVAVIGISDEKWGEVGRAFVVLKPGATLSIEQVHAHCSGRLSRYKWPVDVVAIDALPRTPSGKVQKFLLRK